MQKTILVSQGSRAVSLLLLPMLSSVARKMSSFSWTPSCCMSLRSVVRNTLITRRSTTPELTGGGGTSLGRKFTTSDGWVAQRVAFSAAASEDSTGGECSPPCNVSSEWVNSPFLQTMLKRGFFYQCTDLSGLDNKLCETEGGVVSGYLGFDATAASLHVGSLVQIMIMRHLQKCGHRPVILIGGGTTKIGDPSGRDESRQLIDDSAIQRNIEGISLVFRKFLDFNDGPTGAILVNNNDWLSNLGYIDFLREYGSQLTVSRMLNFESVKLRLGREQPLTFLEFNYMLLQAYDFVELYRRERVCLQFGGSDQWGNMVCGVDLGRRLESAQLFALTAPLITTSDGKKMGKSAEGALWLNEDRNSPFDYWQFWRNTADPDVGRFLRLFTEVPLPEVERLEQLKGKDINDAKLPHSHPKIILADEATKMLHGEKCLGSIHSTAACLFAGSTTDDAGSIPRFSMTEDDLASGRGDVLELYLFAGLAKSKSEMRRLIKGGGARINDVKVEDDTLILDVEDFKASGGKLKLSSGKKKHAIIEFLPSPLASSSAL